MYLSIDWSRDKRSILSFGNLELTVYVHKIGYARVSTADQNLELQIDALNEIGYLKIFREK